jgi:hypothetical protein
MAHNLKTSTAKLHESRIWDDLLLDNDTFV